MNDQNAGHHDSRDSTAQSGSTTVDGRRPHEQRAINLPNKSRFHLFLLAGQSNMAGRGSVAESDRVPHPRVLSFDKPQKWVPAIEPLHSDKPDVAGVGPGRTFAIAVAEANPDITVGLIPAAAGGSPITVWQPEKYWKQTRSHPYDDAIRRTRRAMEDGVLKAILWHQGEGDSKDGRAQAYEERLQALIRRFRDGLDVPDIPFIVGELGQFDSAPRDEFKQIVNDALRTLPENMSNTAFVSSQGLTDKGDGVHFDAESARELGRRYANAYLELIDAAQSCQ